jgi:ComEC/Rec2-related protein
VVWVLLACTVTGAVGDLRLAAFTATFSGAFLLYSDNCSPRALAAILLCAISAFSGVIAAEDQKRDRAAFASYTPPVVAGFVCGFPAATRYGATFPLRTTIAGRTVTLRVRAKRFDVHHGERLRIHAGPVRRAYARAGIAGEIRARTLERLPGAGGDAVSRRISWPAHRRARTILSRRLGSRSALPLALALGERGYLSRSHRPRFVRLGISHLFALSGMHLGIVAAAVILFVPVSSGRWALFVAAVLAAFVMVVGDIDSLQRALTMAVLALAARQLDRPVRPLDVWATAACMLLWADPHSVRSIGLQFSLLATLGVLVAVGRMTILREWIRGAGWLRRASLGALGTVSVGVAATVAVLPLQLRYFGEVSLAGPVATVVFLPAVGVLLVVSLALVALDPLPFIPDILARVAELCAGSLEWLLRTGAAAVPPPFELSAPDPALYYPGLLVCVAGCGRVVRVAGVALMAASFAGGG